MSSYTYPLAGFGSGIAPSALHSEVNAVLSGCTHVNTDEETGTCDVFFASDLSAEDKSALDGVVAAHVATPPTQVRFHGSSTIAQGEAGIPAGDWVSVGGVVTTPSFFAPVASLKSRIIGSYKTTGTGAEIRLMEDGTTELGRLALPDSSGAWAQMQWFSTTPGSEGAHEYTLEVSLGTATSASVRYVSMSLLEFYT